MIEHHVSGEIADVVACVVRALDPWTQIELERRREPTRPALANRPGPGPLTGAPPVRRPGFNLDAVSRALSEPQDHLGSMALDRFQELRAVETNAEHDPLKSRLRLQRPDDLCRDILPELTVRTEAVN